MVLRNTALGGVVDATCVRNETWVRRTTSHRHRANLQRKLESFHVATGDDDKDDDDGDDDDDDVDDDDYDDDDETSVS